MANDFAKNFKKAIDKRKEEEEQREEASKKNSGSSSGSSDSGSTFSQRFAQRLKEKEEQRASSSLSSDETVKFRGRTVKGKLTAEDLQPVYLRDDGSPLRGAEHYDYVSSLGKHLQDTEEEEPRDATLKDMLWNSAKRGYYNSIYGAESFNEMMGWDNEKDEYERLLAGDDYRFETDKWWEKALSGTTEFLGQTAWQLSNPTTLVSGLAGAGTAFALGQAGPQIALPEEIITVPGGFMAGMTAGGAKAMLEIEAGHAYNEMIELGLSQKVAKNVALGIGGVNAGLEMFQLDELFDAYKVLTKTGATDSVTKRIAKELIDRGVDVAKETAQEVAQEGVTIAGTQFANKQETGEWAYDAKEVLGRLGDTALSSALAFGTMNLPSAGMHTAQIVNENKQMSDIGKQYQVSAQEAIEEGLSFDENTEAYRTAAEAKAALDANQALSDAALGRVIAANEQAIQQEERIARQNAAPQQTSEQSSDGHTELAKAAMEMAGVTNVAQEGTRREDRLNALGEQRNAILERASALEQKKGKTEEEQIEMERLYAQADELMREIESETETATTNHAAATDYAATTNKVPFNVLNTNAPQRKQATYSRETVIKNAGFGEHGTRELREYADQNRLSIEEAQSRFQHAYEAGLVNTDPNKVKLTTDVQRIAFNAGKMDYIQSVAKAKETTPVTHGKDSGFDTTHLPSDVTHTEAKLIDTLSKGLGVKTRMAAGLKGNAEIRRNGEVLIDIGFERVRGSGKDAVPVSIVYHAAHEIGMHRLMELAPEEGRAFINDLYHYMIEADPSVGTTLMQRKQAEYRKQDVFLSADKALEEISANAILQLYENEEAFAAAVERIINGKNEKAKSGAKRFKEILDDIVQKLKDFVNTLRGKEKVEAQEALSEVERLRDRYEKALSAAVAKNRELEKKQALAESEQNVKEKRQGIETSAQQEYNGSNETQYALKYWKPDLNKTEWSIVNSVMQGYHSNKTWEVDDITVGFHVKTKGEEVFGYYSTDDDTLLYASGGDDAVADNERRGEIYRRFVHGSNKTRRTLDRHFEDLWNQSGIGRVHSDSVENRKTAVATGELSETLSENRGRNTDQGRNNGRSGSNPESRLKQLDERIKKLEGQVNRKNVSPAFKVEKQRELKALRAERNELRKTSESDGVQYSLKGAELQTASDTVDPARLAANELDVSYSLKFSKDIAKGQLEHLLNKKSFISEEELKEAHKVTAAMVDVMMKYSSILPEDKVGKVLTNNGSYDKSVENTTICVRTLAYNEFVDKVQEELGRPLTQMESFLVSQKLYDIATEPQCLYCYVSLDRKAFNDMLLRYMHDRDTVIDKYNNSDKSPETVKQLYEEFRNGRKDTTPMRDRFNTWIRYVDNGTPLLSLADIATEARQSDIKAKGGVLAEQLNDARKYAQSASWSKIQKQYVAYRDEILKLGDRVVKNLNEHYGMRWYSFSDYSAAFIVENMQQITDAAIKGLKGLAYTKDTDFVEIFAKTGMNINISVFVNQDKDGKFFIDEKQSASFEDAKRLRAKYPNVGIVATVTNDDALSWAASQEWSDVIIPFHIVRTGTDVAQYYKWLNYTAESADTIKDQNLWDAYVDSLNPKNEKARKKVSKNIYPNEHNNNKVTYLRLCEERGLTPRFDRFKGESWYMKLVNESRQAAKDTKPLKPEFDLDAAKRSFKKFVDKGGYEGGWYNEGVDVDAEAKVVAQDVREGKKANEVSYGRQDGYSPEDIVAKRKTNRTHGHGAQFSLKSDRDYMDAVNRGDMNTAQRMVEQAAKKAGYNVRAFHQTGARFTRFNTDNPVAGKNDSETPNGIFFKDNDHDIGLGGQIQMGVHLSMHNTLHFANRKEANAWYCKNIDGYKRLQDEMNDQIKPIDDQIKSLEDEMFAPDTTDERYEELDAIELDLIEQMRVIEDDYRGRLRSLLDEYFLNGKSGYDSIELDYDGHRWVNGKREDVHTYIIFDPAQVKSADPVTYDDNGNVIPLSQRFNSKNEDIRYSLKTQGDFVKDSADRKVVNTALRRAYKNGEIVVMDKPSLQRMTKRMMDSVGSKASVKDMTERVTSLYEYIVDGENGDRADFNTAYELAYAIGTELAESAVAVEQDDYQDMKELRDVIRTTGISINKAYDHDLIGYESINEFRKANFGRIKLTNEGIPVDSFYQELASSYPGYFNESEYTTQPEQLMHIAEVLDGLKPTEYNPYEGNTAEVASWFASDLLMRIYGMQNDRIADVIIRNEEKAARAVKRESAKRAEAVKKVRTKYKDRDLRDRIERHAADLRHKLLRPSDKHHIPDEFRGLVLAVLDSINLESKYDYVYDADGKRTRVERATVVGAEMTKRTQAFSALKDRYAQLAEEGDMVVDPDLIGDAAYGPGKLDKIVAMGDIPIANMNSDQLQLIWDVIRSLEHGISKAGKTLSKAKYADTAAWAEAITLDTGSRRTKKGGTAERFRIDLENPLTFFSHYGEAGKAIFRMLRDAQDRQQQMVSEIKSEVQRIVDRNSVEKWERDIHTFTTDRGDKLTLSTAHIMEIYLLMKREQAQDHLLKGGIVQPEIEGVLGNRKKINRGTDAVLLTFDDLAKIIKTLTKEQIQVADGLQQLTSSTLAEFGNEASMKAYGYRKFTGKDYWTIKSAQEGVHSNVEKGGNNTRSIKNIGLAKSVVPHANNPLDIGGVFKTFSAHAGDMIDYAAWLCPMEDANRLFNFKFKGTGKTMKGLLERYGGKGAQQYWSRLMEDIQNGLSATNDSEFLAPINKIIGNVKGASVGANIRVIVQQPTSILRAAVVLNPVNMTKGLAKGVTEGSGWQKALKYSAIAQRKDMGGFDISSPMQMSEILFDSKGKLQRFNELMMEGAAKADSLTWGRIWNACEWEIADTTELKAGTEEFYEAVAEKFTEVIDQSQVVDGVLQRSQTMRSGNAIMKQATSFMGEPTMVLNMMLRAYDAFVNTDGQERSEARKFFGRTAAVLAVTTAVNALAQSIVDGWRDDEEEEDYLERVGTAFAENLAQALNPFGYIPIAKDVISMVNGYNVTRADADVMGDIITAFKGLADSFSEDGKKTVFNASWNLIKQTSKVFGVSAGNIVRDVHGIVRSIANDNDNLEVLYFMERAIYKLNGKNQSRFFNILWRAYEQGNTELYEKMVTDMIDNGIEYTSIQSGMRSRAKSAGIDASDLGDIDYLASLNLKNPTVKEEEEEFTVNDLADPLAYERDYSRIFMDIYGDFLLHGYHNLDAETQNKVLEAAYDYAHETALANHSGGQHQISEAWILEAKRSGLDIGTYIMFNKQSSGLSKSEKLDLMDDMNLRGDEYNALLEAAFFTATDKKKLDAAALGADQYDDYTREFVGVYEDVESSLERSRSWNSYDKDAQDKMLDYAESFAREYALEQLSRGRYDSTTEFNYVTVDDVLGGISDGLDEGEIFEAIYVKGTLPGVKDKNGETVRDSKKDQFIAWMQKKGYSRNKQMAMLQAVGYSTRGF